MSLSDIPGWFALAISLFVLIWDIRRSRLRLQMDIRQLTVMAFEDNHSFVLLQMVFLNPSSAGVIVNDEQLESPPAITRKLLPFLYTSDREFAVCQLPNDRELKMKADEILQPPFDIPPNQSLRKYYSVCLEIPSSLQANKPLDKIPLDFAFYAIGLKNKQIAKRHFGISISQLVNTNIYQLVYKVKIKP